MALYDNYLNKNNLYSRPSEMMSNVNDYLGANRASLPFNQDSLGSMMGNTILDEPEGGGGPGGGGGGGGGGFTIDTPWFAQPGEKGPGANIYGQGKDLLSQFVGDLGALDENQQKLLLDFITGGGEYGDAAKGVSPEEYAQLFDVSTDYTGRFSGFPQLANISEDISNVFASGEQQKGFEQKAVQQANIAQSGSLQGGMGFSGFGRGRGMASALNRRNMMDTLKQRQVAVEEATAGKYGTLLGHLQSAIRSGFSAAGTIHDENPEAVYGWSAGDDDGGPPDNPNPPPDSAALYDGHIVIQNGIKWQWNGMNWENMGPG
jgi:hypothetical protein